MVHVDPSPRPAASAASTVARSAIMVAVALLAALAGAPTQAAPVDAETPAYLLPDGPGATIETTRSAAGRLEVHIRGERFDGRRLLAQVLAELSSGERLAGPEFDLHVEVDTLAGFNGETLRDVDLVLQRRS